MVFYNNIYKCLQPLYLWIIAITINKGLFKMSVKLNNNDEYYLKGIVYSFFFHVSDLKKVNDYYYKIADKYNKSNFILNASAYTLNDYKIPMNAETRLFDYGSVSDVSNNIHSIEMNIIQISEERFIANMFFYASKLFLETIKNITKTDLFETVNKQNVKSYKKNLHQNEIECVKEVGILSYNRLRKYEMDLRNEVLDFIKTFSINSIENDIFINIYILRMKSIKAEDEFLKNVDTFSDYQSISRVNNEECCIVTSLYDLISNKILIPQRKEKLLDCPLKKLGFFLTKNSLLFISFLSLIVKSKQYIDSISIKTKKDIDYKDNIIKLDRYKSLFLDLKNTEIIKSQGYFKLNNKNISFINDLNDVMTKIENKQKTLDLYFSRNNLKTVEKVNRKVFWFSFISIIIALAGVIVSYCNLHPKSTKAEKERIIIIKE